MDDIQLRLGDETNIPEIVELLKLSLGESKLPKNENTINYKHFQNPFGKSIIVLAFKQNVLVGVRCYMQWIWAREEDEFRTFRAVDTAVHPSHQKKGIFTKMNKFGIKTIQENGGDFIFNTPNSKSLPGNLKLGWKKVNNKVKVKMSLRSFLFSSKKKRDPITTRMKINNFHSTLFSKYNTQLKEAKLLFTPKHIDYLNWRYVDNPLRDYIVISESDFYLVGYVRKHKWFKEFRIVEKIFNDPVAESSINNCLSKLFMGKGILLITEAANNNHNKTFFSGYIGPVLVYKRINKNSPDDQILEHLSSWNYSLGDLELF
jgi:hypothetical protein